MKTIFTPKVLLIFASILIFVASCTKDYSVPAGVNYSYIPSLNGGNKILDFGLVDSVNRQMVVSLFAPGVLITNTGKGSSTSVDGELTFVLYSQEDGVLPTGVYRFSSSDIKAPFTFDSGVLKSARIDGMDAPKDIPLTDGNITVTYTGSDYIISFQGNLLTGDEVSGSYSGYLNYEDVPALYKK